MPHGTCQRNLQSALLRATVPLCFIFKLRTMRVQPAAKPVRRAPLSLRSGMPLTVAARGACGFFGEAAASEGSMEANGKPPLIRR